MIRFYLYFYLYFHWFIVYTDETFMIGVVDITSIVIVKRIIGKLPRFQSFIKIIKSIKCEQRPNWHNIALL